MVDYQRDRTIMQILLIDTCNMFNEFEINKKIDILLHSLSERYNSLHKIRGRVQGIGIWSLGVMVGICGWLLKGDIILNIFQKTIYILAAIGAFLVIRFLYLNDLKKGFKSQQRVAVKIEKSLKLFEPGFFLTGDSIFPMKWLDAGTNEGEGKFFQTTYILLYIGILFVVLSILFNGVNNNIKIKNNHDFHHSTSKKCSYQSFNNNKQYILKPF